MSYTLIKYVTILVTGLPKFFLTVGVKEKSIVILMFVFKFVFLWTLLWKTLTSTVGYPALLLNCFGSAGWIQALIFTDQEHVNGLLCQLNKKFNSNQTVLKGQFYPLEPIPKGEHPSWHHHMSNGLIEFIFLPLAIPKGIDKYVPKCKVKLWHSCWLPLG